MAKVVSKEISALERLRGSWKFFETFSSVKISQKSDALV